MLMISGLLLESQVDTLSLDKLVNSWPVRDSVSKHKMNVT